MWDAWETLLMEIVDKHARLKQSGSQKNILRGSRMTWCVKSTNEIIEKESYYWKQCA